MTVSRVTQGMLSQRALTSIQTSLGRLARTQEQMSTGRVLNRPSDSPTDTVSAMRLRSSVADQKQYVRNGQDGAAWLERIDSSLTSMLDQTRRARDLALAGANSGAVSPEGRAALAAEVGQLRASLLSVANTTHMGRPVFGGITAGAQAYDASGSFTGAAGAVSRVVADGSTIRVNVDGPDAFGPDGANIFAELEQLTTALQAGDTAGIRARIAGIDTAMARMTTTLADVGTRALAIDRSVEVANDAAITLGSSLSEVENVDLTRATVDLKMQEVAYQASLAATARVVQPSLMDFLR
ncbi:MAG: flagellar hook-associated protein FlgL [Candidatus Nanopelagicales bacterium]